LELGRLCNDRWRHGGCDLCDRTDHERQRRRTRKSIHGAHDFNSLLAVIAGLSVYLVTRQPAATRPRATAPT